MPEIRICKIRDAIAFGKLARIPLRRGDKRKFGRFDANGGEELLETPLGVLRIFWIYAGTGQIFLPSGFRTKEGDGQRLPAYYRPEPMDQHFRERLEILSDGFEEVNLAAQSIVQSILSRVRGNTYVGDFTQDLTRLTNVRTKWSNDQKILEALRYLFLVYRDCGYSTKATDSFELAMPGDMLAVTAQSPLRIRGDFSCLTMDCPIGVMRALPSTIRLRYIRDMSVGCNLNFDPFRKHILPWCVNLPGETGDGVNYVNSQVVHIAKENSPTHFHPMRSAGGVPPVHEFLLALDPATYGLKTYGRRPMLLIYPDLSDLTRFQEHQIEPGHFVHIPPGTGHRYIDLFANTIAIPGFRPQNEYYIDKDIRDAMQDALPFNPNSVGMKNYDDLEEFV
jgi:hypothetical protein